MVLTVPSRKREAIATAATRRRRVGGALREGAGYAVCGEVELRGGEGVARSRSEAGRATTCDDRTLEVDRPVREPVRELRRAVVVGEACPRSACATAMSAPASSKSPVKVRRKSCGGPQAHLAHSALDHDSDRGRAQPLLAVQGTPRARYEAGAGLKENVVEPPGCLDPKEDPPKRREPTGAGEAEQEGADQEQAQG